MKKSEKMKLLSLFMLLSATLSLAAEGIKEITDVVEEPSYSLSKLLREDWSPLEFFEGLHITGTPIKVDIESYRLHIRGMVANEIILSFQDIKDMESVRKEVVLDCTGVFTDYGVWTGVPLTTLLERASPLPGATKAVFSALDNSYSASLDLEHINHDGIMVAYHFNDREFHVYHGFPLRIVADGWVGGKWVKWLGDIRIE